MHHLPAIRLRTALTLFSAIQFATGVVLAAPPTSGKQKELPSALSTTEELSPVDAGTDELRPPGNVTTIKRGVRLFTATGAEAVPLHTSMLPVGRRSLRVPVQTISVTRGRVDAIVPATGRSGAMLVAPDGITAICSGGRLSMIVDDSSVQLAALEGDALVGQEGRIRPLPAGTIVRLDRATGEVSRTWQVVAAPALSTQGRLAEQQGNSGVAQIAVDKPGDLILNLYDERGARVGVPLRKHADSAIQLPLPHPGTFRVLARAIDENGLEGTLSEPITVQLLGVDESVARREGEAYIIAPGASLPLRGAQGLEVYHESSRRFLPASTSVALSGNRAETFLFRDPRDPTHLSLIRLAPRVGKARVVLGPKTAEWPRDPVAMTIVAHDVHGNPIVVGENFQVRVRVNSEEVDVSWTADNGTARALLPPRQDAGPWVVRVTVQDDHGREVGRESLEVIREVPAPVSLAASGAP